jgi:hypothetical protein
MGQVREIPRSSGEMPPVMVLPGWGLIRRKQWPVAAVFYGEPVVGVDYAEQRLKMDATVPCAEGTLIRLSPLLYRTIMNDQFAAIMLSRRW